eukprot:SM005551S17902  [mRNA]  locus=s5551:81:1002:+ [translate_table: standard]
MSCSPLPLPWLCCKALAIVVPAKSASAPLLTSPAPSRTQALAVGAAVIVSPIVAIVGFVGFSIIVVALYGSIWMSAAAAGCGGALYAAGQLKPAVCFLLLYSVYSAWSRGGVRVVALCAVLAFVTSDILLYVMADELSKDGGAARRRSAWSAGS